MVVEAQGRHVGDGERAGGDGGGAAFEAAAVDERVGQQHDVGAHAVLVLEADDGGWVRVGQHLEEADVEPAVLGFAVLHEGRELVVVADEDEGAGHADGAEADGERDLAGFVDDAVVEDALREDGVVDAQAGGGYDLLAVGSF